MQGYQQWNGRNRGVGLLSGTMPRGRALKSSGGRLEPGSCFYSGECALNHDWLLIVRLLEEFHPHMQVSGPAHCSRKSENAFAKCQDSAAFGHPVRPFAAEGSQVSGPRAGQGRAGQVATRPEFWPPRRPGEWSLPSSIHAMVS